MSSLPRLLLMPKGAAWVGDRIGFLAVDRGGWELDFSLVSLCR